jgi:soluble lytic murein transglycosylase-like protein
LSRGDIHIARAAALALAILLVPARASADVLEIGPQGATWIAGGPRVLPAQQVDAVVSGPDHAFTQIAESAGPANWQALVAQVAAKYDISPALLEAVVWQESRWRTDAVSSAGARGLTQLMPGTARDLGVDPRDPVANLEGGARYLRQMLDAFGGDVERALAAYNAGPARVAKAGRVPAIRETQLYVASIMARLSIPVRR